MASTPATLPQVHRILGIGLLGATTVFLVLRYLGIGSIPHGTTSRVIAYALSGVGIVLAAVAVFVFRQRVPRRSHGQSIDQYWSTPEVGLKMLRVWFYLEGAGTLAAVGCLFTGEPVTAIIAGLANAAYWFCAPDRFANAP